VRQLRGRTTSPALVLKRGLSTDRAFWAWVQRCIDGPFPLPYVDGEILCYPTSGATGTPARWVFVNGIATKVRSADLSATGSQVAIEELHIAHEGLRREDP
jgi:phage tail-like protein